MKPVLANPPAAVSAKARFRVAIVEDRREIRENWKLLLDSFPDFECVCTCASAEEALRLLPAARPEVVLMDIFLPRMTGIECTARLKALLPKTQILILTVVDDDELIFLALEAGADGYLLKNTRPSDLRAALLEVLKGGAPMTSEIARRVVESFRKRAHVRDEVSNLTIREEEVLMLLSTGYSNKEIAERLELSVDTVKSHLKHIYDKMHVRSRTEAVARYVTAKPQTPEGETS